VFLPFGFTAQNNKLDSLRNVVYNYSAEDTTKLMFWKDYHEAYSSGKVNYDSMLLIHTKMDDLADELGDSLSKSIVLMVKGSFHKKKYHYSKAIELYKSAYLLLPKKGAEGHNYDCFVNANIGILYFLLRKKNYNIDSCIFYYNKALKYSKTNKEKVVSYNHLSQVFVVNNQIEKAKDFNNEILEIAKFTQDSDFFSSYFIAQALLYESLGNKDSTIYYREKELKNKEKLKENLASAYSELGDAFNKFEEPDSAILYYEKSMNLARETANVSVYRRVLSSLILIYSNKNRHEDGLDLVHSAIEFGHEIGDSSLIARTKFSMIFIYDALKEYKKAIDLNNELLEKYLEFLSTSYELNIYSNQSYLYYENKDYVNAVKFGLDALSFDPENPIALYNLGDAYLAAFKDSLISKRMILPELIKNEFKITNTSEQEAREEVLKLIQDYYEKSLKILIKQKRYHSFIHPHLGLGSYYDIIGDSKKTLFHFSKAWEFSKGESIPLKDQLRVSNRLYELNKQKKNTSETLKWLEARDSLEKVELAQNDLASLGKKQAEFEYSQKIYADSLEQKQKDLEIKYEQDRQALKLKSEEEKKYYLYGGLFLLAIFLFVLYRRFKVALKQKHLIELQKESIEEKRLALRKTHEGIQDSINYSKRIQKAVFPPTEIVKSLFPTSFLFFKPKDIVSGDFYWVHEVAGKKIIVTADCTGHGVPGAFMTIIGINILKEIVQEGITDAAVILREINQRLIDRLSQSGKDSVKDGMDLALCVIDSNTIEFVGAHLPLYHVREGELVEYKGSNIFLGSKSAMPEPNVHHIPYQKGDLIYMSTDGLPDQKGGEKGKKFYSKRLKDFLLSNSGLSMEEQQAKLKDLRVEWLLGKYEQLDDITVVGVKL